MLYWSREIAQDRRRHCTRRARRSSRGAGAYALFNSDNGTTVVRQVHVTQSVEAAEHQPGTLLSIGSIYKLANRGVVKITVTSGGASPFDRARSRRRAPASSTTPPAT